MKLIEIEDDTVYVQHTHAHLQPLEKPLYEMIDWLALAKQKLRLLETIQVTGRGHEAHPLEGLVALIDNIQDDAEAKGYPVVWFYPAEAWENGELDLESEE
jgi:hypothetical protein